MIEEQAPFRTAGFPGVEPKRLAEQPRRGADVGRRRIRVTATMMELILRGELGEVGWTNVPEDLQVESLVGAMASGDVDFIVSSHRWHGNRPDELFDARYIRRDYSGPALGTEFRPVRGA